MLLGMLSFMGVHAIVVGSLGCILLGSSDLGLWFLMWAEPLAGDAGVHKYVHGAAAQKR